MLLELLDWLQLVILRLAGFKPRWVQTSVGRCFALEYRGSGPLGPVVIQHGISASGKELAPMLLRLRRHFSRILVPELPGHGSSEAPPGGMTAEALELGAEEILDALVDEPMHFYGNSLGGMVAVRYAGTRPGRIRGLLLNSPGGAADTAEGLATFLNRFRLATFGQAKQFVGRLYARVPWFAFLAASGVQRRFSRPAIRQLIDTITPSDLLTHDELSRLTMPVRLLWGGSDQLMLPSQRAWFREHLPSHHSYEAPDGMGHCPYLDRPGLISGHIVRWAREVEDAAELRD
jgi:pimeloyl-ACP methyl ester carboxylesterase